MLNTYQLPASRQKLNRHPGFHAMIGFLRKHNMRPHKHWLDMLNLRCN